MHRLRFVPAMEDTDCVLKITEVFWNTGRSRYEFRQKRERFDKLIAAGIKEEDITAMLEWETDKGCYYGILVK